MLNYLMVNRSYIEFCVIVDSQFMTLCDSQWGAIVQILRYINKPQVKDYILRNKV